MAIFLAILASFIWGVSNHIDKFMISEIEPKDSIKILLVFSTLIAGIVLTPIWLILSNFDVSISLTSLISILAGTVVYIIAIVFYFKAMEEKRTRNSSLSKSSTFWWFCFDGR